LYDPEVNFHPQARPENPSELPQIFDGITVILYRANKEPELKRYIYAYFGEVTNDAQPKEATHIVSDKVWDKV
jgi:hypothetical protein